VQVCVVNKNDTTMKKILSFALLISAVGLANAQLKVTTKSLDLESVNKHKGWNIIDAGVDNTSQKVYVKFASPSCDIDKSVGATTVTTTFNGLTWKIDKLVFDNSFNYINTESKSYLNTKEAILNNEYVYGKKFNTIAGDGLGKMLSGIAAPSGQIDNSYLFTKIVAGFGGIGGFKIGNSLVGIKVGGSSGKFGPDNCFENAAYFKISNEPAKEQKGQLWIPMFNHPIPNGGHILFNTGYVNPDVTKTHNVFRKYDGDANIVKEKALTFDYQCILYAKEIEMAPGKFDYVFVTTPINYKKSTGKLVPANQYEYIRIDGSTFETKHQLTINAPHSQWRINQVFEKDNAVYVMGEAGKNADTYADFSIPKASDYPNFQIAKIENGKLVYVSLITEDNIKAAMQSTNGEKVKPEMHLKVVDLQMDAIDGKFIYSGQQFDGGERTDALINVVFGTNGQLETFIVKEAEFSKGSLVFSKDNKTMHWLIQDVTEYNKWDKKTGTITAKESKQLLTALSVVSYQFDTKSIKYESLKNEDWGLQYNNTILFNNDDEVLLLGGKITKKAKESEVIFITIKK
jgi:hypothetical protein